MQKAHRNFFVRVGGTVLDWGEGEGLPLDEYGPPLHTHPDIGQPWPNSLLDSPSFGQVKGGHQSFRKCPVVQLSHLPLIHLEEGGGGGNNWKKILFTNYMFLSI